jgi:hypothetical protein
MKDMAKTVATGYNKQCGISTDSKLFCWGMNFYNASRRYDNRKYDEEINTGVTQVSIGLDYVC